MALPLAVLNTTFAKHKGPLIKSWARNILFFRMLLARTKMKFGGGTYIEKTISGGPCARGVGLPSGTERLPRNNNDTTHKIRIQPYRIAAVIEIPEMYLKHNMGPAQVIDLLDEQPKEVLMGASQDINSYLLTSVTSKGTGMVFPSRELYGFITFNGAFSSGTVTGSTNGALDFALPAAQTDSVFDLAKSETYDHYNQYVNIAAWAAEGYRKMREIYWEAADFDESQDNQDKGPDMIVSDPDTFSNFMEQESARVLKTYDQEASSRPGKGNIYPFENGTVFTDYALKRTGTAFTTGFAGVPAAANGVTYMINTRFWEWEWAEEPNLTDFNESGPDHDTVYCKFKAHGNAICHKLAANAAITGGAV
jgi:hypothetical protein